MLTFTTKELKIADKVLRDDGYELEEDLRVWIKELANGRSFVIPISAISLIVRALSNKDVS